MRKVLSFIIGISIGVSVGVLLVSFFSPVSGNQLRANLRTHYNEALAAGRKAAAEKRAELEKELADLKSR
jgi:gas vesicle protein